ncbi:cysteine hydrolase family protein [Arthrobacter sp. 18067]|uniref:cysteine hydrolase family protein n=1 Tax=Arthrobacter sp. 18067 TaxID=2681413 RepID=UPI001356C661|nr:isochorismatase family cysteine hydrolase [Arthrobacter sp. 18067]
MPDLELDPSRTALVVMDYQPSSLGSLSNADELVARAGELLDKVRSVGAHVAHVRVGFGESDYAAVPSHSPFAGIAANEKLRATMHADSESTAINERLAPLDGEITVRKTRVGPFSSTDLHQRLQGVGVDTILVAGITTAGVVLSTVRQAADMDYRVVVVSDACADPDTQVHETLVTKVFPRQATVLTAQELLASLA